MGGMARTQGQSTKVAAKAGSTLAQMNDTCGNLVQITRLALW